MTHNQRSLLQVKLQVLREKFGNSLTLFTFHSLLTFRDLQARLLRCPKLRVVPVVFRACPVWLGMRMVSHHISEIDKQRHKDMAFSQKASPTTQQAPLFEKVSSGFESLAQL